MSTTASDIKHEADKVKKALTQLNKAVRGFGDLYCDLYDPCEYCPIFKICDLTNGGDL